jgi:hypothetical protein
MPTDRFENVRRIAVLADCHIHPGGGRNWPPAVLKALAQAELIVTLGDMGEPSGLEALAAIAPVIGVHGGDDGEDARTAPPARVLEIAGHRLGCVFDPVRSGLASASEPLIPAEDMAQVETALFGAPVDVLLYASTHAPAVGKAAARLWVNPGSATLPADGACGAFAWLELASGAPPAARIEEV